jgi:hypothetical protein
MDSDVELTRAVRLEITKSSEEEDGSDSKSLLKAWQQSTRIGEVLLADDSC